MENSVILGEVSQNLSVARMIILVVGYPHRRQSWLGFDGEWNRLTEARPRRLVRGQSVVSRGQRASEVGEPRHRDCCATDY